MTIPQIIPAITARTAAGKLTDDAFIATSALRPSHLRPNFTARSCVINCLPTQWIECRCGCGICGAHDTLYCRATELIRPTFDRRAIAQPFAERSPARHLDNRRTARHRKGFCERCARARSP